MEHRWTSTFMLSLALLVGCRAKTDQSSDSGLAVAPGGVVRIDLGNIDSLGEPTPGPDCRGDSDTIVCTAQQGRVDRFQSWEAVDDPNVDGGRALFSLKGLWRGNHHFQLIRVELGHDSPAYLLWSVREGGWILVQPESDSMYVGKDRNSILVRRYGGDNAIHWDYWNHLDGDLHRYSCTVPVGTLRADSALYWRGPEGSEERLDPAQLQSQPHLDCVEATPVLETVLPGYMEEPQVQEADVR